MAFTSTIIRSYSVGNGKRAFGTYTNTGGSTGGNIITGLATIENLELQPKGTSISANQPVVNETFPLNIDGITVVTSADEVGYWTAEGI